VAVKPGNTVVVKANGGGKKPGGGKGNGHGKGKH